MYYLNAFNEMLKKRQRQNMMGGGGNDYGVGTTAPSGPMGLGPAQDRSGFRDMLNSMSPMSRFAMGMMPVIGPAFNFGRLVDSGISAYQSSQLAPSRDARERSQDQFRASEIADMNAPMQNTPQQSFRGSEIAGYGQAGPEYGPYADDSMDRLSFNAPSPVAPQSSFAGEALAPMAPEAISSPIGQSSFTGESLAPMAGDFGGRFGGAGGGFGGNIGTGNFGGSPADAADLGYAHGGMVHAEHLKGRAPAPDDGYGALQGGEYVITKAAVEKYGKRLLDAINNGTFR